MPAVGAIPPTPPIYGAAPPEVHSTLLNTGATAAGIVAAGTSWSHVAAEYVAGMAELEAILASVQANYQGPSAEQFVMAHQPLLMWMADVAAKATLAAVAHGEIAIAYDTAVAMMPTMLELITNHVVHGVLVGTNFFGVNTIPIGMNEADYIRMWDQAAVTQTTYDTTSTLAVDEIPDTPPSPMTLMVGVGESGDIAASAASFSNTIAAGVSGAQLDLGDAIGSKLLAGQAAGQPASAAERGATQGASQSQSAANRGEQSGQQLKPDQMSNGIMQQFTQIASSAPQAASSAIQGPANMLMQAPQQLASAPQQLSSMLSQFSSGFGGSDLASQGLGQIGFAGTAPVSGINPAGMTSLAGGALGGGPSRPMLPSSWGSAPSSVAVEEAGARGLAPAAAGMPGAGAGGSGTGGSGMMGHGANNRRGKGSQQITTYSDDDAVDEDADADSDGGAYAMSR
ncbi:PPE domain-containing protein [Mycobacterium avium subsp. hominissuis]|uniref:PPE family protein n=1 Tax=Mycobacterium TaxID=1763 RepID=UPI0002A5620B|nr:MULTISPECIES: PPE domain-containing protein [Mycobacterium]AGB27319.1 PPE-repeat containing protein [Mycobacterium sp. JS623]MDO2394815.1 PPE domain-containing protein [Mycobacterium avium subsp. hominissuis]